jgi:hypothetical protein
MAGVGYPLEAERFLFTTMYKGSVNLTTHLPLFPTLKCFGLISTSPYIFMAE